MVGISTRRVGMPLTCFAQNWEVALLPTSFIDIWLWWHFNVGWMKSWWGWVQGVLLFGRVFVFKIGHHPFHPTAQSPRFYMFLFGTSIATTERPSRGVPVIKSLRPGSLACSRMLLRHCERDRGVPVIKSLRPGSLACSRMLLRHCERDRSLKPASSCIH